VHLRIYLVSDQHYPLFYTLYLFRSSTCFEQFCAHPQEDNCTNRTSGITTLSWCVRLLLDLHTGQTPTQNDYTRCCINTIVLLRMSTRLLQTNWGSNFFNVCHPEVFNTYINIQWCISQTQKKILFIIVLRQHVSILIESSSGPSKIS